MISSKPPSSDDHFSDDHYNHLLTLSEEEASKTKWYFGRCGGADYVKLREPLVDIQDIKIVINNIKVVQYLWYLVISDEKELLNI